MSAPVGRDLLETLLVRGPALVTPLARLARRWPPGSPVRRRLLRFQVRRTFAAMARNDVDVVLLMYEPDIHFQVFGMEGVGLDEHYHGHQDLRRFWAAIDDSFGDWAWTVREVVDGGDRVAIRADLRALGRESGLETNVVNGGTAARLGPNGLVTWQGWFVDRGGWDRALEAVGLAESSVTDLT